MGRVNEAAWGTFAEPDLWRLSATQHPQGEMQDGLDAHAIEFIAKPGKTEELHDRICKDLTPILQKRSGFFGAFVLTSRIEPRRVMAVMLWESAQEVANAIPEEAALAGETLSVVADFYSRVRTYRMNSPRRAGGERRKALAAAVL